MNTCIEVKDLTKSFNGRTVVDKISFRVEKGEVFGLLGHNGAGKSTIIDLLLGLKKPDYGTGIIFGLDPAKNRRVVFKRVGVQLQSSNYQNNIRVDELCKEMSALYEKCEDYRKLLRYFSLEKFEKSQVNKLSGGERQRLTVALALDAKQTTYTINGEETQSYGGFEKSARQIEYVAGDRHKITINKGIAKLKYDMVLSAVPGQVIDIYANEPASGEKFDAWVVQSGDIEVVNPANSNSRFIMGNNDVVITAKYKTAATTYTITFDANGGTGTMTAVTGISGEYTLPANGFTAPDGKQFKAWSVGGVEKAVGDKITVTANTTVTAVWEDIPVVTYTVTFDANGGSVTPASAVTGADGKLTSLPTSTRSGSYTFKGWYTASSGGTKITTDTVFDADTTIYAQWNYTGSTGGGSGVSKYTVKFETNGGTTVASKSVTRNAKLAEPTAPTKDGYTFDGWYSDKELKTAYDFSAKVTKSFTLYAKWTEKVAEPDKPTEPVEPTEPTAPEWENPFTDVKKSDWFYTNVEYAVNNKLMNGTTATTFAPNEPLTRGMLVAILYRAEGEPAVNKSIPFSDVDANAYYSNAVVWAQQNGIVNGVTENEFAPENNITREQIAAIMFRFAKYKGYDVSVGESTNILSYTDAESISEYAISAMQYVVGSGLMKGKTETTINPQDNATRAEIAAILQRFLEANK